MIKLASETGFETLPLIKQDRLFDLVARFEPRAMQLLRESPRLSLEERVARWAEILPPRVNPSLQ
ncbi:MAG: hypothetical protein HKL90_07515 [Elusimicrobia bacterium]|nr:hypothetical protein [Elusimicrobiota bacterium]